VTDTPADHALFGEHRFFTLPAGADFLGELSRSVIEVSGARKHPEALSDVLIFVPNRRSARALAGRLFEELGGGAFLPPDIRPLGDAGDNDPALLGELAEVDVRPPMPNGARLGALTRLVQQWHDAREEEITLNSAVSVAQQLAKLLDQAALAGDVEFSKLETLLSESDLAQHWQVSVDFLTIVTQMWPNLLEENGFSATAEQDRLAAEAMCARWRRDPPQSPVFVVGSTGSLPSTRMLMAGAAALPRGAVLFPGLDTENDAATWQAILGTPSHPQHAFAETLNLLNVPFETVTLWPGFEPDEARKPRRQLIQESLAPADATADWVNRLEGRAAPLSRRDMVEQGLDGLSLIEAETEAEEADAIALLMRESLEREGETAALITPDAGLARRVAALMARWGVDVPPSAGTPLLRTPSGSFLLRVLDFVLDSGDPVALASLLKHEKCMVQDAEELRVSLSLLERGLLRGLRRWTDLKSLMDWAEACPEQPKDEPWRFAIRRDDFDEVIGLVSAIEARAQTYLTRFEEMFSGPFSLRSFVETLAELADVLSKHQDEDGPSMLWSGEDGAGLARFLEDLAVTGDWLETVGKNDVRPLIETQARNVNIPPDKPGHPRLHIWGPLEARLQTCDLVILGSLNEGVWPEPPGIDGFLPRHIRSEIGLPDTEARIGLSAHDFAQLASSRRVVMTRAKRVENKPSVASRWLWRLRILASGALESLEETDRRLARDTAHILDWARQQHLTEMRTPVPHPEPRPPLEARPKTINVTDVQQLIRDPYAYYARHVLRLEPLDPLNTPLGPREIGTAMHKALENKDTREDKNLSVPDLINAFEDQLNKVGGDMLFFAEREGIWTTAAHTYLDWLRARDNSVEKRYFEKYYTHEFELASGRVTLRGRADLVETKPGDQLAITDFKTGKPPTFNQVKSGLEPQLPLLAVIAEKGRSKDGPSGRPEELFYFGLGTKVGAEQLEGKDMPVARLMDEAEAGFRQLMESYFSPTQPYLSGPRVQFAAKYKDYDRLARKKEWADAGAEQGGEA
jgi:ATP-dependent helicase/nuclease subunit B